MNKWLIVVAVLLVLAGGVYYVTTRKNDPTVDDLPVDQIGQIDNTASPNTSPSENPQEIRPSDESAETVAFQFMLDFAETDEDAYDALSQRAKTEVSRDNLADSLNEFIGVDDIPEMGVSVEDLQVGENEASLIVGMNYSEGRQLRSVNMVVENGEWKVDSVSPVTYM